MISTNVSQKVQPPPRSLPPPVNRSRSRRRRLRKRLECFRLYWIFSTDYVYSVYKTHFVNESVKTPRGPYLYRVTRRLLQLGSDFNSVQTSVTDELQRALNTAEHCQVRSRTVTVIDVKNVSLRF